MTEHSMKGTRTAAIVAALVACPLLAFAQAPVIVGLLKDSSGAPIGNVDVSIVAQRILVRSDTMGHFAIRRAKPGAIHLEMRHIGYEAKAIDLTLRASTAESVTVTLAQTAQELPGMVISAADMRRRIAIEDFYRRRALGSGGFYVTRQEIENRHALRLSDALRDAPGIQFTRTRDGGQSIRFVNSSVYRRDCQPQYWVDGQRVMWANIDDFPAHDIEGLELYDGPAYTPMQFSQGAITTCGTVVIWSRVPGT